VGRREAWSATGAFLRAATGKLVRSEHAVSVNSVHSAAGCLAVYTASYHL